MYESFKITNKCCGDKSVMTKRLKYLAVDFCLKSHLLQKKICVLCGSLPELRFRAHGCKVELKNLHPVVAHRGRSKLGVVILKGIPH